ncbi:uncharacterized protein LOC111362505 [Spodoptera litura]|uniref:Uncharacterized protein LOC111362505 n=1 Tax=Spodoptera litura TaxID=69820 RepID=A0A9J7EPL3_SPOLT|nr:uncharacterized protein LOC111362505 [Spodoptera litura]
MEKFTFKPETKSSGKEKPQVTFNGPNFYCVYKDAEFLRSDANIEMLLARGYELRQKLKSIQPGSVLLVDGMNLEHTTPLLIKKTGPKTKVEDYEITYNRLMGLTAAYVFENRKKFLKIQSSEPKELGLVWDQNDHDKCKLYLSAVSGTEHMIQCFSFWPLICGLRKFQLKKLPAELVIKMGNIKDAEGVTMAKMLKSRMVAVKLIWTMFPGASLQELDTLLNDTHEFKGLFQD